MNKKVLITGAILAAFTVVTTFIVHLVDIPASTFEERLQLNHNPRYIGRNILTILHCIAVAISMAAMAHARKGSRGYVWMKWGATAFLIFSVTEIVRMTTGLVYANGLRSQFLASSDPAQQELIRFALETQWPLVAGVLFTIFIIAFGFGCLFMGIGVFDRNNRLDAIMGSLFVFWAIQSFTTIANGNLGWGLDSVIFWLSITFQPAMRLLVAVWLFKVARNLSALS